MLQRRTLQKSVQIAINDSSLKKNARTSKSDEKMFEKSFLVNCTAKEAENEFYITERALNKNCIEFVRVIFCLWAVQMTRVAWRVPHFGAGIVWGTIPSGFPVFWIIVPGCSRNGYGTSPNLWDQKKLVKFWQGTQDAWLCSAKFFWEFLSYSAFDLLRKGTKQKLHWTFLSRCSLTALERQSVAKTWIAGNEMNKIMEDK